MNTWIVGRHPIAHFINKPIYQEDEKTLKKRGEKVFFLKGRIMAGQADITGNTLGVKDFKWLTQKELAEVVGIPYFLRIRNSLYQR